VYVVANSKQQTAVAARNAEVLEYADNVKVDDVIFPGDYRDNLGQVFAGDRPNQLQSLCCERVCGSHWILSALPNMAVR
jgi:hypothetical protein